LEGKQAASRLPAKGKAWLVENEANKRFKDALGAPLPPPPLCAVTLQRLDHF